jgi:hypothetical protein
MKRTEERGAGRPFKRFLPLKETGGRISFQEIMNEVQGKKLWGDTAIEYIFQL